MAPRVALQTVRIRDHVRAGAEMNAIIVPDPPEGEQRLGGPNCGTCGWPIEKVIFAWTYGEFTAALCTNRDCPKSRLKEVI